MSEQSAEELADEMELAFIHPIGDMSIEEANDALEKIRGTRVDAVRIAQAEGRKHTPRKQVAAKVGWSQFKDELEKKTGKKYTDEEFAELMKGALQ
jgi:hypothetical protein